MKAILTLGIVLGLLMTFGSIEVTAQREIADFDAEEQKKNIEICTQNLIAMANQSKSYQKEKALPGVASGSPPS